MTRALFRTAVALMRDRKAATAVEYGLIVALIVIALITGVTALGGASTSTWDGVRDKVVRATGR